MIWWNAATIPFTARWWDPPFFFPMHGALALSEHLAGLAVVSSPVQLLGGSPVLAYNVSLLASYALSAWFMYLLVLRLCGSAIAAFCAGFAYGFAPIRAAQLSHLQVLTSQWLPLQLLAMHAYLEGGGRRWLVLAGVAWLIQGFSNGYYLLFAPVLIGLWLAWFPRWRGDRRRAIALAATLIIASLPFLPVLLNYREIQGALGLSRGHLEIAALGASLAAFVSASDLLAFWPPGGAWTTEHNLFPGATVLILIAAIIAFGVVRGRPFTALRRRSPLMFYTGAALIMAAFALGPGDPAMGAWRWVRPYFWLTLLPGFGGLRVPARFVMLSTLCAAVAVGLAVARLTALPRLIRAVAVALVVLGLAIDGWTDPVPLIPPPGRLDLTGVPAEAAILELPPDDRLVSRLAMFRALFHRHPLVNGYSGYVPPHYEILSLAIGRDDPSAILELTRGRPLLIVLNEQYDAARDSRNLVEALPGIRRMGGGSGGTMYLLPARPRERVASSGSPLSATMTSLPRAHAVLDFGTPRLVRTIELRLGRRHLELGGRVAIEKSFDGVKWDPIWEDWTGGRAMAGALEDPRVVAVRIPLPDISTRYLRMHPVEPWMLTELRIWGP